MRRILIAVLLLVPAILPAGEPELFPWDPVALVSGEELAGSEEWAIDRGHYRYRFASQENYREFRRHPDRYQIQQGGACGRMGPLSGTGQPELHALHDGRIYLFASEQCRARFLEDPARLLQHPDSRPEADPADLARADDLLDAAVRAMGGQRRIDNVRTYVETVRGTGETADGEVETTDRTVLSFPGRFRHERTWGEYTWGHVATGRKAWSLAEGRVRTLASDQEEALRRQRNRHLIVLLKARTDPGFQAAYRGIGRLPDGRRVHLVETWLDGATTTLGLDRNTRRVVSLTYRGRGPRGFLGEVVQTLEGWEDFDGLLLPTRTRAWFEGRPMPGLSSRRREIEVNANLARGLFRQPRP